MSNIAVEGFGHYGIGSTALGNTPVALAMLSGTYAQVPGGGISQLPWNPANTDLYYYLSYPETGPLRRVLPTGTNPLMLSCHYAISSLPGANNQGAIVDFRDGSNIVWARLVTQSTGALAVYDKDNNLLVQTAGPVIVAQTDTFLEMKIDVSTGTFVLYVNGGAAPTINASGLSFAGTTNPHPVGNIAQFGCLVGNNGGTGGPQYITHVIVRNTSGTYNNTFPIGDRRVATLVPIADDSGHQGWTARPRKRFGAGILDNRAALNTTFGGPYSNTGVGAAASTGFYLGSGDFTIEAQVRFNSLPTGANKSQIFGLWDETNNKRSYQFYMGGPSLESGNTVFRISTNGTAATVSEIFSWPWVPETGRWYHVAVVRASGETLFFIDGVQQGLPAADSNTYFNAATTPALGVQNDGGNAINLTNTDGFFDEFRLTVGFARYTSNFVPPSAAFPRGAGSDAHWANVVWLSGFDTGMFDESGFARTLTALYSSAAITPDDGVFNYECLTPDLSGGPRDDTFVEAAYLSASSILTQTAIPANNSTVTVGTYLTGGTYTAAVYTWKTTLTGAAFEVLIGASINASLSNLAAAINLGPGIGTLYGTGTLVNNDVAATLLPVDQMKVTANLAGAGSAGTTPPSVSPPPSGNFIPTATNDINGSWTGSTLAGGQNIPAYSQFYFKRPPTNTTIVDSVTVVSRTSKTDNGTCAVTASFVGVGGGVNAGANNPITTVPTYYQDTFETDPDTAGALTPTAVAAGRVRLNRTA